MWFTEYAHSRSGPPACHGKSTRSYKVAKILECENSRRMNARADSEKGLKNGASCRLKLLLVRRCHRRLRRISSHCCRRRRRRAIHFATLFIREAVSGPKRACYIRMRQSCPNGFSDDDEIEFRPHGFNDHLLRRLGSGLVCRLRGNCADGSADALPQRGLNRVLGVIRHALRAALERDERR